MTALEKEDLIAKVLELFKYISINILDYFLGIDRRFCFSVAAEQTRFEPTQRCTNIPDIASHRSSPV